MSLEPTMKLRLMIIDESEIISEINTTWRFILTQFIALSSALLINIGVIDLPMIVASLVIEDCGVVIIVMDSDNWKI